MTRVTTSSGGGRTLLLTGATGFVGSAVRPALERAGWRVRVLTRDAARAAAHAPTLDWVQGDVGDREAMARALEGVDATLYLVHGIREGAGYHGREVAAAADFAAVAAESGVDRIVYLGGVAPVGPGSEHLRSRIEVGETLRAGSVSTIELRASMIVGHGSLSWLIVRDLAARLPVMVLPRWLRSRTQPVAIDDVVVAVVRTFDLPIEVNGWFDIPGPETLSGKEILDRTAVLMGLGVPRSIDVPFLSPRLSSLWIRLVTRADWSVAREIVIGLTEDLLARDDDFWARIDHPQRMSFDRAARRALAAERGARPARGPWGLVERARGVAPGDDDG
ncbi:MAG: NAD-dependent epimerase/dehydratase family protein [Trueperaceae bacterium]|nr:MAG: NAD-dependent epimerase/dehydratase family protein [Trueperaceae bacterium]